MRFWCFAEKLFLGRPNTAEVGFEPKTIRYGVKYFTTRSPRSQNSQVTLHRQYTFGDLYFVYKNTKDQGHLLYLL